MKDIGPFIKINEELSNLVMSFEVRVKYFRSSISAFEVPLVLLYTIATGKKC